MLCIPQPASPPPEQPPLATYSLWVTEVLSRRHRLSLSAAAAAALPHALAVRSCAIHLAAAAAAVAGAPALLHHLHHHPACTTTGIT